MPEFKIETAVKFSGDIVKKYRFGLSALDEVQAYDKARQFMDRKTETTILSIDEVDQRKELEEFVKILSKTMQLHDRIRAHVYSDKLPDAELKSIIKEYGQTMIQLSDKISYV